MFPPIEAYAVNFAGGNLHPHFNPYGWPDVRLAHTPGETAASADSKGYRLSCTATGSELANSLYLVLPQSSPSVLGPPALPADVRGFLRVTFDLPHAAGAEGSSVFTQAWAVSANLRIDRDIDNRSDQQLNVTSQFVSGSSSGVTIEGVRLNTPGSLQQQVDQQRRLDGPLDYARYEPVRFGPWFEFPGAIFVLDHAFCGYAAATNGHTPGSGKLRIRWFFGADKRDQRVYSSQELMKVQPLPAGSTIGAVGVSIATLTGVGTFGARVRSFQLWLDRALGPFAPEVADQ